MADGWLDGLAQMWGVSNNTMGVFLGFIAAFTIALFVAIELKKHGHDEWSDGAIAVFFLVLFVEVLLGVINWFIFLPLLIIFGAYEFQQTRK